MSAVTFADLEAMRDEAKAYADELSMYVYIMLTAFCIVFMQAGFALLESGGCRSKNAKSILYKNAIDLAVGVLMWWFWGYGFATADSENYAQRDFSNGKALSFLITVAFCTTSATIVSGAVAERINFWVYMTSTISIAGASYPLIMQWVWTAHNKDWQGSGWLLDNGVIDFAGSGVVHLLGATAAFVAAVMIGPRVGRFTTNADGTVTANEIPPYDPVLMTIGTWILVFGWLSFNGSSSGAGNLDSLYTSARAVVMTIIALGAGGFCSTMLGSLVAITAPCSTCDGVGAFFIGGIGGILSLYGQYIPVYFQVDDPLDTFTVHGINGAWGLIAVGLFAKKEFVGDEFDYGVFYGGEGTKLGYQIATVLVIIAVASSIAFISLGSLYLFGKYVLGMQENVLRIAPASEIAGLDIHEFKGYVFPEHYWAIDKLHQAMAAHESSGSVKKNDSDVGTTYEPKDDALERGVAMVPVAHAVE